MPELPDVEEFRRTLAAHATGHRITDVEVYDRGALRGTDPQTLARALTGHRFDDPHRHGKWLVAGTDGPTVVLHFGMTGDLRATRADEPRHRHDRVAFTLADDGSDRARGDGERAPGDGGGARTQVRYRDMRKLQGIGLAADADDVRRHLADLGPDAAEISGEAFDALVARHRGAVKTALTDQRRLAGLGNLLADEILWQARVHPRQRASALDAGARRSLYRVMRRVLRTSVRAGRVPPRRGWLTGVRDASEPACPRCGTALARDATGGRSTRWCPRCQPAPAGD